MSLAEVNAKKLLNQFGIKSIADIDLVDICFAENLFVKYENDLKCEGRIVFDNYHGIITLDKNIIDLRHKRFVLAHEMGHFFNEKQSTGSQHLYYNCTSENFYGISGIDKGKNECNANSFAAELLLPEILIRNICFKRKFSVELIEEICSKFTVSLCAASIRIINLDIFPIAIVMTHEAKVKWTAISPGFKYKFIPKEMQVDSLSYAYDFYKNKPIPDSEDVPAEAWFKKDYTFRDKRDRIMEKIIPMQNFNSAMVVLW